MWPGAEHAVTPNLDRLAAPGARYDHAFASAPVCAPSRSALMTGCFPTAIGTMHMRTKGGPGRHAGRRRPDRGLPDGRRLDRVDVRPAGTGPSGRPAERGDRRAGRDGRRWALVTGPVAPPDGATVWFRAWRLGFEPSDDLAVPAADRR